MSPSMRRLSVVPVTAMLALGVAACGGNDSSSSSGGSSTTSTSGSSTTAGAPATVAGKTTRVVVAPAVVKVLQQNSITVAPVKPATAGKALVFPVTGGSIVVKTLAGTLDHSGGLTFSKGGKTVKLTSFRIDTNAKQLTAEAGGQRVPIFDLNLASLKRATGPNGTVVASNIRLTLTSEAATALNDGLGVKVFAPGLGFGNATTTVAVG